MDSDIGIQLTDEEVKSSKVDLIYVTNGERAQATMALAFIEDGLYKWVSADDAIIVTQNGSIVKTSGLDVDILYTHFKGNASFPTFNETKSRPERLKTIDINEIRYGDNVKSSIEVGETVNININGSSFSVVEVIESVEYTSEEKGSFKWKNYFYYDPVSSRLLKSIQKSSPEMDMISISYVSRALRLNS